LHWVAIAKEKRDGILGEWQPPRFWPMRDRWNGQKVALLCAIREGGEPRPFPELTHVLVKDCTDARLEYTDITTQLNSRQIAALFERNQFDVLPSATTRQDNGILLAILYDIDPNRKGTKEELAGVLVPAIDSRVRVIVLTEGAIFYAAEFKDVAGGSSQANIAERSANVLVRKYLVPECPALENKKGDRR
jgi:hypothetical protein